MCRAKPFPACRNLSGDFTGQRKHLCFWVELYGKHLSQPRKMLKIPTFSCAGSGGITSPLEAFNEQVARGRQDTHPKQCACLQALLLSHFAKGLCLGAQEICDFRVVPSFTSWKVFDLYHISELMQCWGNMLQHITCLQQKYYWPGPAHGLDPCAAGVRGWHGFNLDEVFNCELQRYCMRPDHTLAWLVSKTP